MIARRDMLISLGCVLAAGSAAVLKPHKDAPLLRGSKLADLVPTSFGGWVATDVGDPLAVNGEDTLSAKLYNEVIGRLYVNEAQNIAVWCLLAYGGKQSDELQLHRPEVCYPAFGFNLVRNDPFSLPVGGAVALPARRLIALSPGQNESIIYWSRLGELLPQDGAQQRRARIDAVIEGVIPDGLLARFSMVGPPADLVWSALAKFAGDLVLSMEPAQRKVLIGTERANRLLGIPRKV